MSRSGKLVAYVVYAIGAWIGFWSVSITLAYIYLMSRDESYSLVRGVPLIFTYVLSSLVYSSLYIYFIKNRVIAVFFEKDNIILRTIKKEYIFKKHNIIEQYYRKVDNSLIVIFKLSGKEIKLRIPNKKNI